MRNAFVFEFHVSKAARDRYGFDELLFAFNGNVIFANVLAARQFANRLNLVRRVDQDPARSVRASDLYAMGLIDEALHALFAIYRKRYDQRVMTDAIRWFEAKVGSEGVERTLLKFVEQFPPVAVYRGEVSAEDWLKGKTGELQHRSVAMEELIMLWLANANPAFRPHLELFDETVLNTTAYGDVVSGLREYFATRPRFGAKLENFLDVLRAPALASPDSLAGQLAFLREHVGEELGGLLDNILVALDVMKEEELAIWSLFNPVGAQLHQRHFGAPLDMGDSSAAAIPHFAEREPEYERFSPDVDWMPSTVLLAKSVYVWLDQLSKKYGRSIQRLNEVPDEELAIMARRGFNSLWLIGIWERSAASRRIKQLTGNPDAAASAYSLYDYRIAEDLGGYSAYQNLRDRAFMRGIRLASDMVPNHMGVDSRWVIEHPDWFISLPYPPFPAYSFNGPDLSSDGRVEIKIEDHYYDRTDAAVVFRRVDRWTGDTRYVYHGNDGTTFPWNDTAQLNYLNPEVREAVIQTIIHVARMFPIIRFDAAMTLTKQHYQRLWFPAPGTGGAIPSRAEHGLNKQQFDAAMPKEFWREVVDRIAVEVPGTLLLAEAFWLLEGYFVRTLGMHRVYNSAFMNMMRDEENANYRTVLKNTLEFDPDVLKRYVNFMNNPDERTAVDQFGRGDKYFGVCTMLATLPGLPMFGHGQIEGFTERYGMEFRRAQHEEQTDTWLVSRHEREITPLLHRRRLFAEANNFLLYDFWADNGTVNEDVFAYSNRMGDERALIVFHNRYADTQGWVRESCAYAEKQPDGSKRLRQRTIGESFGFSTENDRFVAYRDAFSGQEYLHKAIDVVEKGVRIRLGAYQCHVLLDWREMREDEAHPWSALCDSLHGEGVSSLDDALRMIQLKPLHDALKQVLDPAIVEEVASTGGAAEQEEVLVGNRAADETSSASAAAGGETPARKTTSRRPDIRRKEPASANVQPGGSDGTIDEDRGEEELFRRAASFFHEVQTWSVREAKDERAAKRARDWQVKDALKLLRQRVDALARIPDLEAEFARPWPEVAREVLPTDSARQRNRVAWGMALAWAVLDTLSTVADPAHCAEYAVNLLETARLRQVVADALERLGAHGEEKWRAVARVRFSFAHPSAEHGVKAATPTGTPALSWLHDPEVGWLIGSNEYEGVRYFNKEEFERLIWWLALRPLVEIAETEPIDRDRVRAVETDVETRCRNAESAGYRVEGLLEQVGVL